MDEKIQPPPSRANLGEADFPTAYNENRFAKFSVIDCRCPCPIKLLSGRHPMTRFISGFVITLIMAGAAVAQPSVERGKYLVNTIMTCANCHSPKGPPA